MESLQVKCQTLKNVPLPVYDATSSVHSWFATVVDGNELGPVYPFQLNKLEYEDFMVDFGMDIHIPLQTKTSCMCAACCDRGSLGDSPVSWKSNSDDFPFLSQNWTTTA